MKGPWKLVAGDGVASDDGAAEGVPEMITSGSVPVEAACSGVVVGATDGWTISDDAGSPLLDGSRPPKRDERSPP